MAGGGIGGLCCAVELMERGQEVTLLETAGHAGGHVRTIHDPLANGLYADSELAANSLRRHFLWTPPTSVRARHRSWQIIASGTSTPCWPNFELPARR